MKSLFLFLLLLLSGNSDTAGVKNVSKYALEDVRDPTVTIENYMQGIWKLQEDTNSHNYFILEKDNDKKYSITYMNRGGDNRGLEHFGFFMSEINDVKFITVSSWNREHPGWVFLRVNNMTKWEITAQMVADDKLHAIKSQEDLRNYFEKNLNNPAFYGKELHFEKRFEFNSWK